MMSFSVVGMYNKKQGILAPYIAPDCVYFIPTGNALRATFRVSGSETLARRRASVVGAMDWFRVNTLL